ncbi:hypothetical protein GCM10009526_08440 [Glutamicibacter creatinolyticus]
MIAGLGAEALHTLIGVYGFGRIHVEEPNPLFGAGNLHIHGISVDNPDYSALCVTVGGRGVYDAGGNQRSGNKARDPL